MFSISCLSSLFFASILTNSVKHLRIEIDNKVPFFPRLKRLTLNVNNKTNAKKQRHHCGSIACCLNPNVILHLILLLCLYSITVH